MGCHLVSGVKSPVPEQIGASMAEGFTNSGIIQHRWFERASQLRLGIVGAKAMGQVEEAARMKDRAANLSGSRDSDACQTPTKLNQRGGIVSEIGALLSWCRIPRIGANPEDRISGLTPYREYLQ